MNTTKLLLAPAVALLLASSVLTTRAVPIVGQVNISGTVVLNTATLGTATSALLTTGILNLAEGSYPASLVGDTATYSAFNFALGPQVITPLWTVTDLVGTGFVYSFNLANVTTYTQAANNLFLAGTGTLTSSNPVLSPTAGLWTYNINSADGSATNGRFSFQSNNTASGPMVPDGGDTVLLLSGSFLGFAFLMRRKTAI